MVQIWIHGGRTNLNVPLTNMWFALLRMTKAYSFAKIKCLVSLTIISCLDYLHVFYSKSFTWNPHKTSDARRISSATAERRVERNNGENDVNPGGGGVNRNKQTDLAGRFFSSFLTDYHLSEQTGNICFPLPFSQSLFQVFLTT